MASIVSAERRAFALPRVPLDVMVELTHEDFPEPFEADAVDLSGGGLALRAAYLPDVGSKLLCRFECPPNGERIEADGEVVWAASSGEREGHFGVRFFGLEGAAEARIRSLVSLDALPSEDAIEATHARLMVDGVSTAIVARVTHRASDLVAVEQELPFLRLGKGVSVEDGGGSRRGRIEQVELSLDGELPRLILTVLYEEESASILAKNDDTTIPDMTAPTEEARAAFREKRASSAGQVSAPVIVRPSRVTLPEAEEESEDDHLAEDAPVAAKAKPVVAKSEREAPRVVRVESDTKLDVAPAADAPSPVLEALRTLAARIAPLSARARAQAEDAYAAAKPKVIAAWNETVRLVKLAVARAVPMLRTLGARLAVLARGTVQKVQTVQVARGAKVKRTTAPAPGMQARGKQVVEVEPVAAVSKTPRRIALGVVVAVALGLAVYALTPAVDPAPVLPAPIAPVTESAAEVPAQESGDVGALQPAPVVAAPVIEPPIEPQMPTALPAPVREAGRLPAPTYASVREGERPPAPPEALPTQSPYGVDVRGVGVAGADPTVGSPVIEAPSGAPRAFGTAAVPGAQRFVLRMSRNVTGVRGTQDGGGFTVLLDGALSLDRASPIAERHPLVESAIILNRGDHAELRIVFNAGASPAYRVQAQGASVEVLIARR